ncbi:hypothetical protein [Dyadobacter bucti]|uniref:hypothetical protein n=1 Tax=Dyadobacter bucti TaxID=2572203 RepID=UPI003F71A973
MKTSYFLEISDELRRGTGGIMFNFGPHNRINDFPTSWWLSVKVTGTFDRSPGIIQCQEEMVRVERSERSAESIERPEGADL